MPTATLYRYNLSETPNDKVEANRLVAEIRDSDIVISLDHIDLGSYYCDIWFKDELSYECEATLSGVFTSHTGEEYYQGPPLMPDGRPIVRSDTRPLGTQTYFTCAGDKDHETIGEGKPWVWDFSNDDDLYNSATIENGPTIASGLKAKIVRTWFNEPVHIKDGAIYFVDATFGSYLSMYVTIPSGNYYPNASGTYPASALGLDGNEMYAYATNDVLYSCYVNKHYMLGDCPMGDELNAEASSVDAIPAGWAVTCLVVTDEDNDALKGHGSLELYRYNTTVLPGGAFNGVYSSEQQYI